MPVREAVSETQGKVRKTLLEIGGQRFLSSNQDPYVVVKNLTLSPLIAWNLRMQLMN